MPLLDWLVIAAFLALVTWMGNHLSGGVSTRRSFFQADGGLPWWAVSASIVATKTSAVTFVAVPAFVFGVGGDSTYIQVLIGLIIGTLAIAWIFVPDYRHRQVDTVFDYIAVRMDRRSSHLALALGLGTAWLAVAVRLLTTAVVLSVATGWPVTACTIVMTVFSVLWSWLAGIRTVIWTDALLYVIFTAGAVVAVIYTFGALPVPFAQAWTWLEETGHTAIWNLTTDPRANYTLWTGLIGASMLELSNAITQSTMQRAKSCRSDREAIRAFAVAAPLSLSPFLMVLVGLGLAAFYHYQPLSPEVAAQIAAEPDRIFPHFIVHVLPVGLTGLLIAAIFAAGASTLNSVLAELSDITVTNIYEPYLRPGRSDAHYLAASKWFIIGWAVLIAAFTIFISGQAKDGLLNLAFQLPGYVGGASLGTIILARLGIGRWPSYTAGLVAAIAAVVAMQQANISFFWWFPAGALAMIAVVLVAHVFTRRSRA